MRRLTLTTAALALLTTSPAFANGKPPVVPPPFQGGGSTSVEQSQRTDVRNTNANTLRSTNTNTNVNAPVAKGGSARAQGGDAFAGSLSYTGGSAGGDAASTQKTSVVVEDAKERAVRFVFGGAPSHGSFSAGAAYTDRVVVLNQGGTLPLVGGGLHWDRIVEMHDAAALADAYALRELDEWLGAAAAEIARARLAMSKGELGAAVREAAPHWQPPTVTLTSARLPAQRVEANGSRQ